MRVILESALTCPECGAGDDRNHADRCVPLFLRVHELPGGSAAQARRLLRLLFLRHDAVSADPGGRCPRLLLQASRFRGSLTKP
jgi:hypothetical protein